MQHFDQEQVVFVFMGIFSKQALLKKRINRFAFHAFHLLPNQPQEKTLEEVYGVRRLPHHSLIGKDGKIIQNHAPGPGDELMDILKKLIP